MAYLSTTLYKITPKGKAQVERLRGRLSRWFDINVDLPYSTKEGIILQYFAERPEGASPDDIWQSGCASPTSRFALLPMQITDTIALLLKKGYIVTAE